MKIAICYYGLSYNLDHIGGSNAYNLPVNYQSSYDNHRSTLIDANNADVFLHTWDHSMKGDLIDKYKPLDYLIEPQIDFTDRANKINNDPEVFGHHQRHHILSRWYSTMRVVELKKRWEHTTGVVYDLVMLTRYDCQYNGDWILSELSNDYLYITDGWNADYNREFPDLWFIGNTDYINLLGGMFENMHQTFYTNDYDNTSNYWGGHLLVRRYIGLTGLLYRTKRYKHHHSDSDIKRG